MAAHQGVDFFEIRFYSGHSISTNQERYLDWNILTLTFPGTYTLNGWVDKTPKKCSQGFIVLVLIWRNKLISW